MLETERWLRKGFRAGAGATVWACLCAGEAWQLYDIIEDGYALITLRDIADKWVSAGLLPERAFTSVKADGREFSAILETGGLMISSAEHGPYPHNSLAAGMFARAIKETREIIEHGDLSRAIFVERYARLLPTGEAGEGADDNTVLGRWLASGVNVSMNDGARVRALTGWMSEADIERVASEAGVNLKSDAETSDARADENAMRVFSKALAEKGAFKLPGRPNLEAFFNEHVVDVIQNFEAYERMGVGFPAAIVLSGPPGCGKTFAADKLIEHLGFKRYSIDSGSIGSSFIHDTSKKIADVFTEAIRHAPSVIVIDEMDAFLSDRGAGGQSGLHHVEEVAEFLKRIPQAAENHVLVLAMTNRITEIDPAILRRGRFDHIIEIGLPSTSEVKLLLEDMLEKLPAEPGIALAPIAGALAGRPISDIAFVVKQAGRMAVKRRAQYITAALLKEALNALPGQKPARRRIGF